MNEFRYTTYIAFNTVTKYFYKFVLRYQLNVFLIILSVLLYQLLCIIAYQFNNDSYCCDTHLVVGNMTIVRYPEILYISAYV